MIVQVNDVSVTYGEQCVLDNVALTIDDKEMIAITGDNGSGKTTLIKVITGLTEPTNGCVLTNGNLNVGYVPQITKFEKDFPISVEQVILSGCLRKELKLFYTYTHKDKKYCKEIMKELHIYDLRKRTLNTLSGGQLQKVLIARALVAKPNLLILDEPTASIDDSTTDEIFVLLKTIAKDISVLIVSHDQKRVRTYPDKIYEVKNTCIRRIK